MMESIRKLALACVFASGLVAASEAQEQAVTQADLKAILARLERLEQENRAQAARIAELEGRNRALEAGAGGTAPSAAAKPEDAAGPESGEGAAFTAERGGKFRLADAAKGVFEPLSERGLRITPYGFLAFEAVHNTHKTDVDMYSDWVRPRRNGGRNGDHQTIFGMNDSIIGFAFGTPGEFRGWKIGGKFEFDFAGANANDPRYRLRHLYFDMDNEEKGLNILFGQTWHLWKMVSPSEIDGAWLEQTGHPYRRSPQVRLTKRWEWEDSRLEIRAGLVKNGNGMGGDRDGDANEDNSASAWALLEGAVVYERDAAWEDSGRRWLVGLAGMYGRDRSHRVLPGGAYGASDEYDVDMVMAAARIPFLDRFTLTGQLFAGENLAGVQGGIGQGVAFRDMARKGREVSTVGGFVDLRYELNDDWSFAVGYGFDDPTDSRARYAADRAFNARAYVDAFYRFSENLRFGLEYARLQTKYCVQGDADDDRIQFSAWLDF